MPTILHISDLHRDQGSKLTTASLLESLRLDRERYRATIKPVDLAIVSGDIVYGVTSDDVASHAILQSQYDEAHHFLVSLAELFFEGDRERVVLIPGNHDVSHAHVLRATAVETVPSDAAKRSIVVKQLLSEDSLWRWDWSEFSLRRISDSDAYVKRMEPFANFYRRFYKEKRAFSLDPGQQFAVHDFPALGLAVVGLSSCYENDLFNRCGRIHTDCVAGATREIADLVQMGRIPIATWHHNLAGGPRVIDYVDADFLQALTDGGFAMGLHGHQHKPQFLEQHFTADPSRMLAVISAGTLCGGPHALPSGRNRAYNLISIDAQSRECLLYVREMRNEGFGSPVWGEAAIPGMVGSALRFKLSAGPNAIQLAAQGEELLRRGDAEGALRLLKNQTHDVYARHVIVAALLELKNWSELAALCRVPQSNQETIALLEALYEIGDKAALRQALQTEAISDSSEVAVRQCVLQSWVRLGDTQ